MNDIFNFDEAENKKAKQAEEEAWQMAKCIDTLESYRHYMDSYPQGLHITEAHHRINDIVYEQKERIIQELCEDRNAYHLNYIKACGISIDDLMGKIKDSQGQVRDEVLRSWNKLPNSNGIYGQAPEGIPIGAAEIYFWGVHGSGKTCVLEAILSYAEQMGFIQPPYWPIFNADQDFPAVALPEPTQNSDRIQYIPLALNDVLGKIHRLSIVDIPGDIFDCFRCELMGQPFKTKHQEETYKQLKKYLNSKDNPKYHFFILDSQNSEQQMINLQYAALYFGKNDVFNETTLGINLIVTKSDLLSPDRSMWTECAKRSAQNHFMAFINTLLKRIVGSPANGGLGLTNERFSLIPFSIGEVFFQDLCIFNPESAKVLVDLLMCYADEGERLCRNPIKRISSFLKNGMGGIIDECISSIETRGFSPKGKITMTRNYGFVLNDFGRQIVIRDDAEQHLIRFKPSTEFVSIAGTFKDEICLTIGGQIFTSREGEGSFRGSDLMLYTFQFGGFCHFESISAGEGHIVGVNYDGTVFCWDDWRSWEGVPDFKSMVKGWRNIKQVAVGYENIIALSNDGHVFGYGYCTDYSKYYGEYSDFIQVDAYGHYYGDTYSMALRSNGTVMSPNFEEVSAWHDIVQIAVGWDAAVGLRRDGGVNIVFYDDDVVKEVSSWTNIVNIECKFSQIIAISREGRIYSIKIH